MSDSERGRNEQPQNIESLTDEQQVAAANILKRIKPLLSEGESVLEIDVWTWAGLVARSDSHPEGVKNQIKYWLNHAQMRTTLDGLRGHTEGELIRIADVVKKRLEGKPQHYWKRGVSGMFDAFIRLEKKTRTATWRNIDFWTLRSSLDKKFLVMGGWMKQEGVESWKVVIREIIEDYQTRSGDYPDVHFAKVFDGNMVTMEGKDVVRDEEISEVLAKLVKAREANKDPYGGGWTRNK